MAHKINYRFVFMICISIVVLSCRTNQGSKDGFELPEYFYTGDGGTEILKIYPKTQKQEIVLLDHENMTWNSEPVYLPGKKIIVYGTYPGKMSPTLVVDLNSRTIEKRLPIYYPLYFYKHNMIAYLQDGGVYISTTLTDGKRIADDAQAFLPQMMKMSEDELGFFGFDLNKKKVLSVYNFKTNRITTLPQLNTYNVSVFRTKTREFYTRECANDECHVIMLDEAGNTSYAPTCVDELAYFQTVLQYDEIRDQLYFFSGRAVWGQFLMMGETKDLYVYDYKTDRCVMVFENLYSTGLITSDQVNRIEGTGSAILN